MDKPKKQHYVQRAHLDRWSDCEGNLYVCDLTNGNIHKNPAKSVAWKKYYYCIDDPEHPESRFEIEAFLGTDIEGPACPVIQKFCDSWKLTPQEKDQLALYVSFQKLRVPFFEKFSNKISEDVTKENVLKILRDKDKFEKFQKESAEKYGEPEKNFSREDLIETIEEERLRFEYPRAHSLKSMIQLSLPLAELYARGQWIILEAKESNFIISDNPAVTISLSGKSGNIDLSETTFPLSPKYSLLINQQAKGETIACDEDIDGVRELNRRILLHATRFLFGNDKTLLEECYAEFNSLKPLSEEIQSHSTDKYHRFAPGEKLFNKRTFEK